MANIIVLPQIGIDEESAVLVKWHVQKGDIVNIGDIIFSLETNKATFDVESEYSGTILELLVEEGDEVFVAAPICALGQQGEEYIIPDLKPESNKPIIKEVMDTKITLVQTTAQQGISPRARHLASKNDVDPKLANPTGPEGRVIERDIRNLIEYGVSSVTKVENPMDVGFYDKPLSRMRKTISKNIFNSLSNSAQLTHTASFDASCVLELRKGYKNTSDCSDITLGDMVMFAVSRTLPFFPDVNSWFMGDTIRYFENVNLAFAVDIEDGLLVPVIFGACKKSLLEISNETKSLAKECRDGTVSPNQLTGGSFTISNLGQYGIESFTPILNPPQNGILGVNTITTRVRVVDGEINVYPSMSLSFTYDHRALDGAPASRFLQSLCKNMENFTTLLAR